MFLVAIGVSYTHGSVRQMGNNVRRGGKWLAVEVLGWVLAKAVCVEL